MLPLWRKLKKAVEGINVIQVELEQTLDSEIADMPPGNAKDMKENECQTIHKDHHLFLQCDVNEPMDNLDILLEDFQEIVNQEKAAQTRSEVAEVARQTEERQAAEQKRIRDENHQYELENAERLEKIRLQERKDKMEDEERLQKQKQEEREHEILVLSTCQKHETDLAEKGFSPSTSVQ